MNISFDDGKTAILGFRGFVASNFLRLFIINSNCFGKDVVKVFEESVVDPIPQLLQNQSLMDVVTTMLSRVEVRVVIMGTFTLRPIFDQTGTKQIGVETMNLNISVSDFYFSSVIRFSGNEDYKSITEGKKRATTELLDLCGLKKKVSSFSPQNSNAVRRRFEFLF